VKDANRKIRDTMVWHFPNSGALESTIHEAGYKLIRNYSHLNEPLTPELELYETVDGKPKRVDVDKNLNVTVHAKAWVAHPRPATDEASIQGNPQALKRLKEEQPLREFLTPHAELSVDAASVILKSKEDRKIVGKQGKGIPLRLPKGNAAYDKSFSFGHPRMHREVDLMN